MGCVPQNLVHVVVSSDSSSRILMKSGCLVFLSIYKDQVVDLIIGYENLYLDKWIARSSQEALLLFSCCRPVNFPGSDYI